MKWDFAIGNPPYHETLENTSDKPVYNDFMDAAFSVSDVVELITPARFLFDAGKTPKNWNEKMLSDEHLKVLLYEADSNNVFSNTEIKGGVAVTYRNNHKKYGAIENFTPYAELNSIFNKVRKDRSFESISSIVITSFAYHYTDALHRDFPTAAERLSKGHAYDLKSNAFDRLPDIFTEEQPRDSSPYIKILGRQNNSRAYRFIRRDYVNRVENLDKYKLFIPKANGSGTFGEVLTLPELCGPGIGATESFVGVGMFDSVNEAENLLKYIKTKFLRTMLGVLKITQEITPSKWKYVPLQDFTENSDINWNTSIANIDKQLYKKYGLSQEEIDFIETHVKEMV